MKWLVIWIFIGGHSSDEFEPPPVADVAQEQVAAAANDNANDERSITDIRRDFRDAMRAQSKFKIRKMDSSKTATATTTPTAHRDAIGKLIELHREMVAHSTFENGFAMQESRALLQNRLVKIERDIRKVHDHPRRNDQARANDTRPAHVEGQPALAQLQIPQIPGGAGGNGGNGMFGGGAGNNGGGQQGQGGQLPDIGPELADLIQQVIDPQFWDVNGGPGSIVYFRPLRALIVTATAEVHHRMAGVFGQMRDAL